MLWRVTHTEAPSFYGRHQEPLPFLSTHAECRWRCSLTPTKPDIQTLTYDEVRPGQWWFATLHGGMLSGTTVVTPLKIDTRAELIFSVWWVQKLNKITHLKLHRKHINKGKWRRVWQRMARGQRDPEPTAWKAQKLPRTAAVDHELHRHVVKKTKASECSAATDLLSIHSGSSRSSTSFSLPAQAGKLTKAAILDVQATLPSNSCYRKFELNHWCMPQPLLFCYRMICELLAAGFKVTWWSHCTLHC